ncbi:MAG: histidinol dehydrogenase [Flavobacteriaceae bacterium]|nr:histidinol dehydrogenase [Flavobacteriaceae bacterium]
MKTVLYPKKEQWQQLLERPTMSFKAIEENVNAVFNEIRSDGDRAIKKFTTRYDGVEILDMQVSAEEIADAELQLSAALKEAILQAKGNIEKFHEAQRSEKIEVETVSGVRCWQEKRPIEKVGLYIPGGSAPLFSTVLMLAIPARLAGCKEIILCSPPGMDGKIHPAILYTAQLCGVNKIFTVGGIQAIGGMTFGTETIPKAYKIFGPGNQFVTVAKQVATKYNTAIDMPAGPSELLVVADDSANAAFIASDLLSQAEHGKDSQVLFITNSKDLADQVKGELATQLDKLPRKDVARAVIENSIIFVTDSKEMSLALINEYGPEHIIICSENEDFFVENILNAGSVFIGNYTPESAGDYASGTNHTLPTNGYAKQYSGVNLDSFMKAITFQKISKKGIMTLGKTIELMAEAEGLQAHKNAVTIRLKSLEDEEI